jgi:hypothetical protein
MKKLFYAAVIVALAAVISVAAGDDSEIQEFHGGEDIRKMEDPVPPARADDDVPSVFIPINEITITENPVEGPAPNASETEKKGKTTGGNAIGGRLASGNPIINLGAGMKIGLSASTRIDAGINTSFLGIGQDRYWSWSFETVGFYEWHFNISDDGIFNWFAGPGAAFGYYGTSGYTTVTDVTDNGDIERREREKKSGVGVGFGGQIGLEVDLRFIDPDHSLYETFKNTAITLDIRALLYPACPKNYPWGVITFGIGFRYLL